MPRYAYVNGRYVPHEDACVHIEDRGYQFADGVYEVIGCVHGHFADERGHLERLERSLSELQIDMPVERSVLQFIMRHLLRLNKIDSAAVYIQVTRGVAPRDFKFPKGVKPALVLTCRSFDFDNNPALAKGAKVVSVPDQRWARRDIKTVALLPQALAKQKAAEQGAYEAWMIGADGVVTEGSSSNAWIYDGTRFYTHPSGTNILKGVTRTAIMEIAAQEGVEVVESGFTLEQAYKAQEAFSSSATALLLPVVQLDDHVIGNGEPGVLTQKIYERYRAYIQESSVNGGQVAWTA